MTITPNQRDNAINAILEMGLTPPVSMWAYLRDMYKHLGLRNIFWESLPAIAISVCVAALYATFLIQFASGNADWNLYSLLFMMSPILFICLTLSADFAERCSGLYELKMTCKYTIRQIATLRLLCFSLAGMIFAVVSGAMLNHTAEIGYMFQLLSLVLCSVFLCALSTIYIARKLRNGWYLGSLIWVVASALPMLVFGQAWESILVNLPPAATLAVAATACTLFLREIKIITREVRYADC